MKGMQNKTIKKVLRTKLEDWMDSIDDKDLVKDIKKNVIVTGGSIASMIMGDKINDYDLYFRTKAVTKSVAQYYANKFNLENPNKTKVKIEEHALCNILGEEEDRVVIWVQSEGAVSDTEYDTKAKEIEVLEPVDTESEPEEIELDTKYKPIFLSENAITLSNKVQLVIRFYGEPEQIHRNYDFVHAKCYYDYGNNVLETPVNSLRAMQSKTLKYEGSLYPVCSLFRTRKFIERGWKISAGEILKIAMQISTIDLINPHILKEQLVGVDALYFHMLISALKRPEDSEKYSTQYVIEVINRIFSDE